MKCKKCGKRVPKGAKICPYCNGNEIIETENGILKKARRVIEKIKEKKKIIIIIASIILALLVAFIIVWNVYLKYTKLNLNNYITVKLSDEDEFADYNGCGNYTVKFDKNKLLDDIEDAFGDKEYSENKIRIAIDDAVKIVKSKNNGHLKNGEIFTITIKIDNTKMHKYDLQLSADKIKKKVAGLKATEELDPFKDATMKTEGASPNVKVAIINTKHEGLNSYYEIEGGTPPESDDNVDDSEDSSDYDSYDDSDSYSNDSYDSDNYSDDNYGSDDYYDSDEETTEYDYSVSNKHHVNATFLDLKTVNDSAKVGFAPVLLAESDKNIDYSENEFKTGDEIEVEVNTKIYKEGNTNYLITKNKHIFKLEKASEYLKDASKLTEKSLKNVKKEGKDVIKSVFSKMSAVKKFDIKYKGAYLMVEKQDSTENFLELVYKITFLPKLEKKKIKCYISVQISDACINDKGMVEGDASEMEESQGSDDGLLYGSVKELYLRVVSSYSDKYKIYNIGDVKKY